MSLFPLDIDRYKEWTIQQLYYMLFPFMKDDFMGKSDCQLVHQEPNMTVVVAGAPATVTHIIRGGSDTLMAIKEAEYRALLAEGRIVTRTARESGRFTGR